MSESVGRIFGALAGLAALWIVVYWWWEPSRTRVSFPSPAAASGQAAPGTGQPVVREPPATAPVERRPPTPRPPVAPPPRIAVVPPKFREYTVKPGETFEAIAERELGSRRMVDALRRANPLMDPEHVRAGRVIQIPLDPANIQGKPVEAAPTAPTGATGPTVPTAAPAGPFREYVVKSGDSLSTIAKSQYGSIKYIDLIFEANRDQLESPDSLHEGQKLKLPPKPAG